MSHTAEMLGLAAALVVLFVFGVLTAPTREDAEIAVRSAGHKDVVIHDWLWIGCSKGDTLGWSFSAKNALDAPVSGIVCCGNLKACTVRY